MIELQMPYASFTITRRNGDVYVVLVDADDLERALAAGPWRMTHFGYVRRDVRVDGKKTSQSLHRFIMGEPVGLEVDHVNMDRLDNRRSNLRVATHADNAHNVGRRSNNTSGYKGVSRHRGKWIAQIVANGKQRWLGYFTTAGLAHEAYCRAAAELHGEFARNR